MALSAATNWDVRTGGSDSNGGGFVVGGSGVDYSQQNTPQFSGTDLASVSSLVVASVGHAATANEVNNLMNIPSGTGFTPGIYWIVSVASGQYTLDRSPGTVGASGTWAVGGSLLTIGKALGAVAARNTIYVKNGTYTVTSTMTLPALSVYLIGYNSTHGDYGSPPTVTTATNSTVLFTPVSTGTGGLSFSNFIFTNTAGTAAACVTATNAGFEGTIMFYSCKFSGFSSALYGIYSGIYCFTFAGFIDCEITGCTGPGGAIYNDGALYVDGCYIHGNTNAGVYFDQNPNSGSFTCTVVNTVFYSQTYGIYLNTGIPLTIRNCDFSTHSTSGVRIVGSPQNLTCVNNIFDANSTYGLSFDSTPATFAYVALNNAFYNNGANWHNLTGSLGDISLSGSPYTLVGTTFTLNSTAGAGAACKAAAAPLAFPGSAGNAYQDVGALQSQGSGGGGTTVYVIAPTINNIIQEV